MKKVFTSSFSAFKPKACPQTTLPSILYSIGIVLIIFLFKETEWGMVASATSSALLMSSGVISKSALEIIVPPFVVMPESPIPPIETNARLIFRPEAFSASLTASAIALETSETLVIKPWCKPLDSLEPLPIIFE